jgi:hypothetical protein
MHKSEQGRLLGGDYQVYPKDSTCRVMLGPPLRILEGLETGKQSA